MEPRFINSGEHCLAEQPNTKNANSKASNRTKNRWRGEEVQNSSVLPF